MTKSECFSLGFITKTWGNKGGVNLYFDCDQPDKYLKLSWLYIDIDDNLVKYSIKNIRLKNITNVGVVHFEDVNTMNDAEKIIKHEVFLPLTMLPPLDGNRFYFHEVVGFNVIDAERGNIGNVKVVLENFSNPLLQVMFNNKEILIPVNSDIIKTVDRNTKTLTVDCPDGLIDLYLNNK